MSGQEFHVLGQQVMISDPAQAKLAVQAFHLVHEKVEEIRSKRPLLGPTQISVLALMELAGNLVRERQEIDAYRTELDRKCSELMSELTRLPSE